MNATTATRLVSLLGKKDIRELYKMLGKNEDIDRALFDTLDIKNPTAKDIKEIKDFIETFENNRKTNMDDVAKQLRRTLSTDPRVMAIITGLRAASSGVRAAGDISENNANRLATALLEANRHSTDQQNQMYGKTEKEKLASRYGQNMLRKAGNTKIITDAVANVIDKTLGDYQQEDIARRSMSASPYLEGVPGNLYELVNGMQSRSQKISKNLGV